MGFGAGDVVGLIWSHPIASVVVALLFTPPLFPIVVFFSPLLISTALVVLAMISMGSDGEDSGATPGGYEPSHYKRDWHEQEGTDQVTFDDEDGPLLNDEDRRLRKRHKGVVSHEDGWFDKVKSWEETGRAWVDSVLHQEARKPSSEPLFSSAVTGTREVRFAQPIPQPQAPPTPAREESSQLVSAESTENLPPLEKDPADAAEDQSRAPAAFEVNGRASDISVEPDEMMIELPAHSLRAFPLPDEEKVKSSENRAEDIRPKEKWDEEHTTADVVPQVIKAKEQQKGTVQSEASTVPREEVGAVAQNNGDSSSDRTDQKGVGAAHESSSGNSVDGKSAPSSLAAAERERRAEHHRTPSVAVTLSEKLNVPLEDIMSLLTGDEKPLSSGAAPKESTISHDGGGWSSSDDEVAQAAAKSEEQNLT